MIPVGYMAKRVSSRPEWLNAAGVVDIYSVSSCISEDFADYVNYWQHNGYWFFDFPEIIRSVAEENSIDLTETILFYYEAYEFEFDDDRCLWKPYGPESSIETRVVKPRQPHLEGYDVVTFSAGTMADCSPLSCNCLATTIETNSHCLLSSSERAKELLDQGKFKNSEPGPYRVVAVYSLRWP